MVHIVQKITKYTFTKRDISCSYDDVIKWRHFPRYWPFVRGIHRWPVKSPHKGQWRGALMLSLICAWINGWVNYREAGDLGRHRAHYDVTVIRGCLIWQRPELVETSPHGYVYLRCHGVTISFKYVKTVYITNHQRGKHPPKITHSVSVLISVISST